MQDLQHQSHSPEEEPPKKKRRSRVSRACDECRVRKIRCDGSQPCESCDAFDRACIYRSNRVQKVGGVQHVRALEETISRARNYIEELHEQVPSHAQKDIDSIFVSPNKTRSPTEPSNRSDSGADDGSQSPKLENMMDQQGQMNLSDHKTSSFYGDSSGFAFLQKTKQLFDDTQGNTQDSDLSKSTQRAITQLFDSPLPDKQALHVDEPVSKLLPSRQAASDLLNVVFGQVYPLLQFLHEPTFQERTNRIYEIEPMDFEDSDHDFLPLLYSVLALGFLFSQKKHQQYGCARAVTEGMRHFIAARQMIDVTNCRDIVSLQVLICFILFLMSTARLATSHTYTGLALTSAIRLGLHSQGHVNDAFSELEQAERRRVFETIVKMDIYTSSVLGLPTLTDLPKLGRTLMQDIDIDLDHKKKPPAPSVSTDMAIIGSAKHLEVLLIIAKVINILYPEKTGRPSERTKKPTFFIRISEIMELEAAFRQWRESLPQFLQANDEDVMFESVSYELEMVHNFGLIVLYRPFLHYLAKLKTSEPSDERQLRCALECVKTAQRTIQKSTSMQQRGFLSSASWYSVYTIFLSIVALVFYLAAQSDSKDSTNLLQIAEDGVRILASSECQDIGSRRCLDVLRVLLKRLSHIVDLDIDKIRQDTPSLCQSEHPTKGLPSDPAVKSSKSSQIEKQSKNPLEFDWITTNQSGSSALFDPSWPSNSQQYLDTNPSIGFQANNPLYRFSTRSLHHPGSMNISPHTSVSGPPAQPYPQVSVQQNQMSTDALSFQRMYQTSMSDTMEIPYAESFAWPFQSPAANNPPRSSEEQSAPNYDMYSGQQPLTSEDIAAFMRINPGEHPFM